MFAALRNRSALVALVVALAGCQPQQATQGSATPAPASNFSPPKVVTMDEGLPDPVARVGDQAITLDQLNEKSAAAVAKANQQLYTARKNALDNMINDQLEDAEAKKRGISKDDLVKQEIDQKITPVTDADVQKFYDQNKDKIKMPFDQVKDKVKGRLEQQAKQGRQQEFLKSLRDAYQVQVYLAPPRMKVETAGFPRKGSEAAPVQIVEFSDFQCPFCKKAAETVRQVEEKYGDKVSVVYRNFPLSFHQYAHRAAEASYCAKDQDKFWEFHDQMFTDQKLTDDDLFAKASAAGLDADKFKTCLTSNQHTADVDKDIKDGEKVGMSGTPGFFINGRSLEGAQPIEAFTAIIDEELAQAGNAAPKQP